MTVDTNRLAAAADGTLYLYNGGLLRVISAPSTVRTLTPAALEVPRYIFTALGNCSDPLQPTDTVPALFPNADFWKLPASFPAAGISTHVRPVLIGMAVAPDGGVYIGYGQYTASDGQYIGPLTFGHIVKVELS